MTQDGIVVTERVLELVEGGLAALDVEADVVRLDEFLDRIGQLTTTPVFQAMNLAALGGDERLVSLDHGGHLLALVRMNNENDFVITHAEALLRMPGAQSRDPGGSPPTCVAQGRNWTVEQESLELSRS